MRPAPAWTLCGLTSSSRRSDRGRPWGRPVVRPPSGPFAVPRVEDPLRRPRGGRDAPADERLLGGGAADSVNAAAAWRTAGGVALGPLARRRRRLGLRRRRPQQPRTGREPRGVRRAGGGGNLPPRHADLGGAGGGVAAIAAIGGRPQAQLPRRRRRRRRSLEVGRGEREVVASGSLRDGLGRPPPVVRPPSGPFAVPRVDPLGRPPAARRPAGDP